jgi:hypothetical protein
MIPAKLKKPLSMLLLTLRVALTIVWERYADPSSNAPSFVSLTVHVVALPVPSILCMPLRTAWRSVVRPALGAVGVVDPIRIPTHISHVTPAWLTQVLRAKNVYVARPVPSLFHSRPALCILWLQPALQRSSGGSASQMHQWP